MLQIAPRGGELLGATAEELGHLVALLRELRVREREVLGARAVLGEEARVLDRDGRLIRRRPPSVGSPSRKRTPARRRVSR